MASVTLPRGVLIALVAALLVCLGVTAFLAGRASAPADPGSSPAPSVAAATPAASFAAPNQEPQLPVPSYAPYVPAATLPPAAAAGVVPTLPPAAPADAARVARYFREMETAQAAAKYWTDPQALAGTLVDGLSKGDRSGIDQLIGATRAAVERMNALDVPPDCGEHHRRSLDLVAQSIGLLETIANGATGGDMEAFSGIASKARALEGDAKDVDALAARIKQRYGIA